MKLFYKLVVINKDEITTTYQKISADGITNTLDEIKNEYNEYLKTIVHSIADGKTLLFTSTNEEEFEKFADGKLGQYTYCSGNMVVYQVQQTEDFLKIK